MPQFVDTLAIRVDVAHREALKAMDSVKSSLKKVPGALSQAESKVRSFNAEMRRGSAGVRSFTKDIIRLTVAYLGIRQIIRVGSDMIWTAAKVDLMRDALHNLSRNLSISIPYIKDLEEKIKALGITTEDTVSAISSFMKTGLDITKLAGLARGAQDAAVLSGKTTSDTIKGIVHGVITLQTRVLRTHGVYISIRKAIDDFSAAIGKSVTKMSMAEKQQATLIAVQNQLNSLTGLYEKSMEKVGKRLLSLDRIWRETKLVIGEVGQEMLTLAVDDITALLNSIQAMSKDGRLDDWARDATDALVFLYKTVKTTTVFMWDFRKAILAATVAWIGFKTVFGTVAFLRSFNAAIAAASVLGIGEWIALTRIAVVEMGLFGAATAGITGVVVTMTAALIAAAAGIFLLGKGLSSFFRQFDKEMPTAPKDALEHISGEIKAVSLALQEVNAQGILFENGLVNEGVVATVDALRNTLAGLGKQYVALLAAEGVGPGAVREEEGIDEKTQKKRREALLGTAQIIAKSDENFFQRRMKLDVVRMAQLELNEKDEVALALKKNNILLQQDIDFKAKFKELDEANRKEVFKTAKEENKVLEDLKKTRNTLGLDLKEAEISNEMDFFEKRRLADDIELERFKLTTDNKAAIHLKGLELQAAQERDFATKTTLLDKEKEKERNWALNSIANNVTAMGAMFAGESREWFRIHQLGSVAQASMNVLEGMTKAVAIGGPLGIASAASVAAFGFAQVAKISSMRFGGQARSSGGGAPPPDPPVPPVPERRTGYGPFQTVNFYLNGVLLESKYPELARAMEPLLEEVKRDTT